MNESITTFESLLVTLQNIAFQAQAYLPKILAALLVLVAGWLLARTLRFLIVRTVGRLDQLWQRYISRQGVAQLQPRHPPARIVGELVFWLSMLIFITLSAEILGLDIFVVWLKQIVTYLPLAVTGLLIVLAGFVVSSLSRDVVVSTMDSAGLSHGDLLARTVQIVILLTAIVLGIDQIGINIMFLSVIAGIALSSLLGALALAFGLGAQHHVSNIISANQLRQVYQVGDLVRVGDVEGRIVDIMVSRVIIETETGSVDVPARIFDEKVTTIIEKGI